LLDECVVTLFFFECCKKGLSEVSDAYLHFQFTRQSGSEGRNKDSVAHDCRQVTGLKPVAEPRSRPQHMARKLITSLPPQHKPQLAGPKALLLPTPHHTPNSSTLAHTRSHTNLRFRVPTDIYPGPATSDDPGPTSIITKKKPRSALGSKKQP